MMYPDWQYLYWLRSVFWRKRDFVYRDEKTGKVVRLYRLAAGSMAMVIGVGALVGAGLMGSGVVDGEEVLKRLRGWEWKSTLGVVSA